MTNNVDIREADITDAEIIGEIHSKAWKQAYERVFSAEYLELDNAETRKQEFVSAYKDAGVAYYVLSSENQPVGILKVICSNEKCEIASIYILKEYAHKGIGTKAIDYIKALYPNDYFYLWTLEENQKARHFYEKNGFVLTGDKREINRGGKYIQVKYEYSKKIYGKTC